MPDEPSAERTAHLSGSTAGGSKSLPLLLFGPGIVLVVDLPGLLLYNTSNKVCTTGQSARGVIRLE
jgi:hypothetical protein